LNHHEQVANWIQRGSKQFTHLSKFAYFEKQWLPAMQTDSYMPDSFAFNRCANELNNFLLRLPSDERGMLLVALVTIEEEITIRAGQIASLRNLYHNAQDIWFDKGVTSDIAFCWHGKIFQKQTSSSEDGLGNQSKREIFKTRATGH
jgi:hypothetical protein